MKFITKCFLTLTVLFSAVPANIYAYDFEADSIYYNITSDSTVEVTYKTMYNPTPYYSGSFSIPSTVTDSGTSFNVTGIGNYAFSYCTNLHSITIPASITSIGDWAFELCTGLDSVHISSSVTSIGDWTFDLCTSLTSIAIPSSIVSIGVWDFYECTSLKNIYVNINNPDFTSVGGILFSKDLTELICYPPVKSGNYSIPASVTSIGDDAFSFCTNLTSIIIPSSVTSVGGWVFLNCNNLSSIYAGPETPVLLGSMDTVFENVNTDSCILYVPSAHADTLYSEADQWKAFKHIEVENAPVITSTAPDTVTMGLEYTYAVIATDAENDSLTFSLTNAPKGMTIDSNVIKWTSTEGDTTSGQVTVTVSDGHFSATQKFTITVNHTPTAIENISYNAPGNSSLIIAPTPTRDDAQIIFTTKESGNASFILYNNNGTELFKTTTGVLADEKNVLNWNEIDQLPTGSYYVKMDINGRQEAVSRLIKIR